MFDAEKEKVKIVKYIRDYFKANHLDGVVIGISGGKDSGVVAGLFTEALGKENVLGVSMPCHSRQSDYLDALSVASFYGFEIVTIDLASTFDNFTDKISQLGEFSVEQLHNSNINFKPRLRMATLYYLAALYSSIKHKTYIVAGTSNKCESFVGYFTKWGDGVSDINVLGDLTVEEVVKIGEVLHLPKEVLYKVPDDGLSGQSDEEKLGVSYQDITKYMNGEYLAKDIQEKISTLHKNSLHKFGIPTYKK
ncbi:MAG: NAD(+) synthase [Bacilli bacterium]|nr:NAD(+) synthase [Bacilli bacterium]